MEQSAIQLTDEDLAAAREVLRLRPELGEEEWPKDAETLFAEMHHAWGREIFQVRLGLRPPATIAEECNLAMFRGEMTSASSRQEIGVG